LDGYPLKRNRADPIAALELHFRNHRAHWRRGVDGPSQWRVAICRRNPVRAAMAATRCVSTESRPSDAAHERPARPACVRSPRGVRGSTPTGNLVSRSARRLTDPWPACRPPDSMAGGAKDSTSVCSCDASMRPGVNGTFTSISCHAPDTAIMSGAGAVPRRSACSRRSGRIRSGTHPRHFAR